MLAARGGSPVVAVRQVKQLSTKIELVNEWMTTFILPNCAIDETNPGAYMRCTQFISPKKANLDYNEYLSDKYKSDSSKSACSLSQFNRALCLDFPNILWGSSLVSFPSFFIYLFSFNFLIFFCFFFVFFFFFFFLPTYCYVM
jgi:hypothetical protein